VTDLLIGVDIGTGACKAALLRAEDGQVTATAIERYAPESRQPGWMEQDPEVWYQACRDSIRRLVASDAHLPDQVRGIGITGQMRGVVLIDAHGVVVRPAILWNDNRCLAEVARLVERDEPRLRAITHNVINTMCTLPKLLWLMRHEPAKLRDTTLLYPKDHVRFRLTGERCTDLSDASGSSLFDVVSQSWSQELMGRFAIPDGLLPVVRAATTVAGPLLPQAAADLGLRPDVPVIVGGSDSTVESYAIGVTDARSCKVRLGTSGAVATVVDDIENTGQAYVWSFVRPDVWMLDTNTRACGGAVRWLRETVYRHIEDDEQAFAAIDRDASEAPVGANGLLFHPYLLGEDAPYWDPSLRATFTGLGLSHGREHLARAVLEGTAFALRDAMRTLGDRVHLFERVVFTGGGTLSPTWLSIVSDVLACDGEVPGSVDAAAGAASLAGVGVGLFSDLEAGADRCYRVARHVHHDPGRAATYGASFERYVETRPRAVSAT
jgi:xylulokinase